VQPVQHVLVQVPVGSTLGAQLLGFKQDHVMPVAGGGVAGGDAAACGHAAGSSLQAAPAGEAMPPGAPAVAWLPAPDLTYDQKLRPPAA